MWSVLREDGRCLQGLRFLLSPSVSLSVIVLPAWPDTSLISAREHERFVSSDSPPYNYSPQSCHPAEAARVVYKPNVCRLYPLGQLANTTMPSHLPSAWRGSHSGLMAL